MTSTTQAIAVRAPASGRQGLGGFVQREWRAFLARKAQRGTVRVLQGLDDATLRDIGLSRSEIDSFVYGRASDRRQHYNAG
jgi:uncharacterized protein YjiS (DUF1127 family)